MPTSCHPHAPSSLPPTLRFSPHHTPSAKESATQGNQGKNRLAVGKLLWTRIACHTALGHRKVYGMMQLGEGNMLGCARTDLVWSGQSNMDKWDRTSAVQAGYKTSGLNASKQALCPSNSNSKQQPQPSICGKPLHAVLQPKVTV
jgi:hypothetical protein